MKGNDHLEDAELARTLIPYELKDA